MTVKTILVPLVVFLAFIVEARTELELEVGRQDSAFYGIKSTDGNDSQIDVEGLKPSISFRIFGTSEITDDYGFRIGFSPLRQVFEETFSKSINFGGSTFASGQMVDVVQDSDRFLIGAFKLLPGLWDEEVMPRIGLMVQGENLEIAVKNSTDEENVNVYIYRPLFYFSADWILSETFFTRIEFDGWADPSIRRLDGSWSVVYTGYLWNVGLGYRIIEDLRDVENIKMVSRLDLLNLKVGMWF